MLNDEFNESSLEEETVKSQRIYWSDEEVEKVADLCVQMRLSNFFDAGITIVNKAIQQLPKERRRNIRAAKAAPGLFKLITEKLREIIKTKRKEENSSTNYFPQQKEIVENNLVTEIKEDVYIPTEEDVLKTTSSEKIIAELFCRATSTISTMGERFNVIEEYFKNLNRSNINQIPQFPQVVGDKISIPSQYTYDKSKINLPRIAIVGLLPGQVQEVGKTLGNKLDLRFISKDQNKPVFPQVDYIILITKFISHNWDIAAKNALPGDRVFRHRGGISELINLLYSFC